ncbi:MAG: CRISPR-associated helicase Cas3' [candidate division KSB1 bacterium]|nr:CRISPR-associated helicase Cas3' [candidate division KSB1 bacterium]
MTKPIPQPWPDYLDDLWAKSPEPNQTSGESLAQHTWLVLSRFSDCVHLRPNLPEQIGAPKLWHFLYWACFLHDFGKAASGFQQVLRGGPRWPHRHEVLSLAFLDWLFPDPVDEARLWIAAAIVSHHRDAEEIRTLYPETSDPDDDALRPLLQQISIEALRGLWRWLHECPVPWHQALHLENCSIEFPPLVLQDTAIPLFYQLGVENVRRTLRGYHRFVRQLESCADWRQIIGTLLLRGTTVQADHTASAHLRHLPAFNLQSPDGLLQNFGIPAGQLHPHQRQCMAAERSTILIAPTGSGKTESALFWAAAMAQRQHEMPRLFYVLPYQASMNAMHLRLEDTFPKMVGLQHSRSVLAVYRQLLEREYDPAAATRAALWAKNLVQLNYFPVRVLSPYQILKACYRLKGYEALLQDYFNAAFIFDEIHAYEPDRLAMIVGMMQFLHEHFAAKFFVMSATLPALLKKRLQQFLPGIATISAAPETFRKFRRHHLGLLESEVLDPVWLSRIEHHARDGMSVLVCCNTVKRAQQAYQELRQRLAGVGIDVVLLHGRFNGRDRLRKETLVRLATGAKSEQRTPIVLVATQVIEVSLDIDLDVLYSDPAPLEALIQRFGRINRRRLQPTADVFVFREPNDGRHVYDAQLVQRGLAILDRYNDLPIDEEQISDWLDHVYLKEVAEAWNDAFDRALENFQESVLHTLRAFNSHEELEEQFYEAFDGIEVLPAAYEAEYFQMAEAQPLAASELLVPMHFGQYAQLRHKGLIRTAGPPWPKIAEVEYSSEHGLML